MTRAGEAAAQDRKERDMAAKKDEVARIRSPRIAQTADNAWIKAKSAHAVAFVTEAQAYVVTCTDEVERRRLRDAVEQIKFGERDLHAPLDVQAFLTHGMPGPR
jgi:hypothetical protein